MKDFNVEGLSSRSTVEVCGCLPRHAMWGSDGRVEPKERGHTALQLLVRGKMNSSVCRDLSFFSLYVIHIYIYFVVLFVVFFCGFSVATVPAQTHCRPTTRMTEAPLFSHCFLRM